jgi:hypothetical protein
MDISIGEGLSSCFDELVDEFIVLFASDSAVPQSQIQSILQEFFIL